jgi:hypothetical protein
MKNIQRWQPDEGVLLHATITGWFVSYAAHEAAVEGRDTRIAILEAERDALKLEIQELRGKMGSSGVGSAG